MDNRFLPDRSGLYYDAERQAVLICHLGQIIAEIEADGTLYVYGEQVPQPYATAVINALAIAHKSGQQDPDRNFFALNPSRP